MLQPSKIYHKNSKVSLATNFSVNEFACKCKNVACVRTIINPELIFTLQRLRNHIGSGIKINSGYRCSQHNAAIGGSTLSQHTAGNAADFVPLNGKYKECEDFLKKEIASRKGGGLKWYKDKKFIHFDVRAQETWIG